MDFTIEQRVTSLEIKVDRIEVVLKRIENMLSDLGHTTAKTADLTKVQIDLAEIKGRVSMLPTWWMLMVTVLSTRTVGAGIVFTLVKATHP